MAQRAIRVGPDSIYRTLDGRKFGVVSKQAQAQALIEAMNVVDFIGGGFSVLPGRAQTGLPGEMVTTELLIKWVGLTEHRRQYEQPVSFEEITGIGVFPEEQPVPPDNLPSEDDPGVEVEYVDEPQDAVAV